MNELNSSQSTNNTLTAIPGLLVGHAQDMEALTGCTVILCPPNTIGGVDQRGGAPGTRETDLLRPMHLVSEVHAIVLTGGSAFGLASADGVMRFLEEHGIGYETAVGRVPIVPAAVLYDLDIGRADRRPDAVMGYAAASAATSDPVVQGTFGAGTGATVGKLLGKGFATKGGVGSASIDLGGGLIIAALMAVNALGDVVDAGGHVLAGTRLPPDGEQYGGALTLLRQMRANSLAQSADQQAVNNKTSANTVIGVVATNARLNKESVNKLAQMGQDGLGQAIRPAHTAFDGDTLFGLATGTIEADPMLVSAFAADVVAEAIRAAVRSTTSVGDIPAARDIKANRR